MTNDTWTRPTPPAAPRSSAPFPGGARSGSWGGRWGGLPTGPGVGGDVADPRWWVAPLCATVAAPPLAALAAAEDNLFAPGPFLFGGSLVAALALILPAWFLARTRGRRRSRIGLSVSGAALALAFPVLLTVVGWAVLVVLLLTGNWTA
ncbi:hypothetical protein [Streptomyces sp. NPDC008121]|uniref:hypothetical protein n=1 Tax=Streptomyces sp. NPDC008121 TaxID=3364809 RepID=UPI0036EB1297